MTFHFPDEIDEYGTFAEIEDIVDGAIPYDEYINEMLVVEGIQTTPAPEFADDVIVVDELFDGPVGPVEGSSDFVDPPLSFDVLSGFVSRFDDVHDSLFMDLSILTSFTILPHARLVKQKLRRLHPCWSVQVNEEIQKQLSVGFLSVVEYPEWLANVVLVIKKDNKDLEVYGDDMIVKSQDRSDHLSALERFFERIGQFILRLNPKKCTFRVTSRKLLGYMVSERDIEVDLVKIRAILNMPASRTEREVRGFLGRLQYINKFITRLTNICEPIFRLLRKSQPTIWDDQCQAHLRELEERAIYYLSKRMLDYEMRYVMIKSYCLALVWATRQLRHYMIEYSVHLISHLDPLRYLFDRPALVFCLMRWLVLLTEFDIHYVTQKSIRGSIVADHLASLPVSDGRAIDDDFPDEDVASVTSLSSWRMYFDSATNYSGYGIGVLLISPHGDHIPKSVRLTFLDRHPATNNIVEYEACILGLETTLELGIRQVEVFGDSNMNQFVDALATLASVIDIPAYTIVRLLLIESRSVPAYCCLIDDVELDDGLPWYHDIYQILKLDRASTNRVMREVPTGVCGPHMGGHMLARAAFAELTSPWPFSVWGIDIIGKISSKSSSGHEFILVAIDYFTKWVEAASYTRLTSIEVASFIRSLRRYGVSHELILDRGTNRAIEVANKNIKMILQRMVATSRDWSEKLSFALWAYRTSFHTSTRATPYSLVYGMEVVLPIEIEMGSLRIALEQQIQELDWVKARLD
ncbi:Retrovirus-related Pol polyprotein from transposon 297 [Vitis vinifera]|uniref:Retrovirus-related Pol polyprotein from transposon 297 n=1 Tax=Vitis vinifera TaxID=29760 RepID=A0A438F112_VITVI|nr:Retrovirus-related Pol polyprotein from transposon 297 [Vitis vinifera]